MHPAAGLSSGIGRKRVGAALAGVFERSDRRLARHSVSGRRQQCSRFEEAGCRECAALRRAAARARRYCRCPRRRQRGLRRIGRAPDTASIGGDSCRHWTRLRVRPCRRGAGVRCGAGADWACAGSGAQPLAGCQTRPGAGIDFAHDVRAASRLPLLRVEVPPCANENARATLHAGARRK